MDHINLDWMISVDDHVLEPPDVWQSRVPAKYRDRAPKLVSDSDGERWVYDGRDVPTSGLSAVVGKDNREFSRSATRRCARDATTPWHVSRT